MNDLSMHGPSGPIDFSSRSAPKMAIKFVNADSGQEMIVEVHDKFPQMGDVHVEGRRYVEVSTEMFIALVATAGFTPVVPGAPSTEEVTDEA